MTWAMIGVVLVLAAWCAFEARWLKRRITKTASLDAQLGEEIDALRAQAAMLGDAALQLQAIGAEIVAALLDGDTQTRIRVAAKVADVTRCRMPWDQVN